MVAPVNLQLQVAWQTGHKEQDRMECLSFIKTQIIKDFNISILTDHPCKCTLHMYTAALVHIIHYMYKSYGLNLRVHNKRASNEHLGCSGESHTVLQL